MSIPTVNQGDYLLCVSGKPHFARYLSSWHDFKDHIRKVVKEQPGWTNVNPVPGKRGEVQGWCKLKDRDDANAVYRMQDECKGILVHVFYISLQSSLLELMGCNCFHQFPDVGDRGHCPKRSGLDMNSINRTFNKQCVLTASQTTASARPTYQYANYYQIPCYNPAPVYAYPETQGCPAATQTPYLQSTSGLPVNIQHGAVLTEARGIFIQGLDYKVRESDLISLIHSVGLRPIEVKVRKDSKGSSKGVATAKFGSKEEAQYGVIRLNGKVHSTKTLTVQLDMESTVVGQLSPPIVDGTNKYAMKNFMQF